MASLAPQYQCLIDVIWSLESGKSVRNGLMIFLQRDRSEFSEVISTWLASVEYEAARYGSGKKLSTKSQVLLQLFKMGIQGAPVLERLKEFEREFYKASLDQIDAKINSLPTLSLLPMLGFIFPAFLILMLGPLVFEFVDRM